MPSRNVFFALLSRMENIQRWSKSNPTRSENVAEHSLQVAMFAHALGVIRNTLFAERGTVDANLLATLALVALMTATAISFVGVIGFIGLVAPHIARMLVGEDQRFLIPLSALCGALMLSTASVVSKSIVPGALFPIGIVTALIGVPFFIWLVLSQRGRGRA